MELIVCSKLAFCTHVLGLFNALVSMSERELLLFIWRTMATDSTYEEELSPVTSYAHQWKVRHYKKYVKMTTSAWLLQFQGSLKK